MYTEIEFQYLFQVLQLQDWNCRSSWGTLCYLYKLQNWIWIWILRLTRP